MRSHGPRTLDPHRRDVDSVVLDARRGVRARPWSTHEGMAHLVTADHTWRPAAADVDSWLRELVARGYSDVRTGAVAETVTPAYVAAGFRIEQTLALLRIDPCARRPRTIASRRTPRAAIRTRHVDDAETTLDDLAAIDRAAFGRTWGIDAMGILDACAATPAFRLRVVDDAAFAVTGRAGSVGFLQRLAVAPTRQGEGIGRALVIDALGWLRRRRIHTAMVNTHTDNVAALALYASVGFERLPEQLHVLRRDLHAGAAR